MIAITQALVFIIPECAKMIGSANPVTTIVAVMKRPKSTGAELS